MTRRTDADRLQHMLAHTEEAIALAAGRSRADLDSDRVLNLALVRLLEIVGEAAARLSESFRQNHTAIPWAQIAGLRNRLIHGYDEVDFDILWDIIQLDLPVLAKNLHEAIGDASA
jgi:uncharacterized protein with HEPN domain